MPEDKVLALLEAADWEDIINRLTHYALWRAWRYTWKSGSPKLLPGGKTPEDVALDAIRKIWDGSRAWDPEKYTSLINHLMWIVNSDMEHLFSSEEHQRTVRVHETADEETKLDLLVSGSPEGDAGRIATPEEELLAREERELEEKLKSELYAAVKGNDDLGMLLLYLDEGIYKPREIAAQTGWDISKIYNLRKNLLRLAEKVRKGLIKTE